MRVGLFLPAIAVLGALTIQLAPSLARPRDASPHIAVGSQNDSTHVYVSPDDFDRQSCGFEAKPGRVRPDRR